MIKDAPPGKLELEGALDGGDEARTGRRSRRATKEGRGIVCDAGNAGGRDGDSSFS